ncbi:hypothetical protein ABPG75_013928 [Micractinium tetrahymenae]
MPAPVAPAPTSRAGSGRAVKPAAAAKATRSSGGGPPASAMQAGLRRSRLQFLLDIAHATFSQPSPPTPQQIDALRRTLSSVPLEELGLGAHASPPASPQVASTSSSRSSSPSLTDSAHALLGSLLDDEEAAAAAGDRRPRPPITYLLIYEDERISLGIFCLPARARIPLHNHPGMTVLSRVLYGEMHVCSYDWLDAAGGGGGEAERLPREAHTVLDRTLSATDPPAVLFPRAGGNIHQFTALTDCAVLDLMSPPYSTEDGRDCTYYSVLPASKPGGPVMLDAYEPPADFVINQGSYRGLQPRKPLPIFAGTSLFPSASKQSPAGSSDRQAGASAGAAAARMADAAAEAAARAGTPPSSARSPASPLSSPTSESTGVPKLSSLLAGGPTAGIRVLDCATSKPGADCPSAC